MIQIKRITEANQDDIHIPNEPFTLWGKMIPTYDGEKWAYTTEKFRENEISEMVFPNENYDFESRKKDCFHLARIMNMENATIFLRVYST